MYTLGVKVKKGCRKGEGKAFGGCGSGDRDWGWGVMGVTGLR